MRDPRIAHPEPRRPGLALRAVLIAALGTASLAANGGLREPPRYDGAGYAVLARALLDGRGYREIDHPDAPRHAHFPPGYPLALAALWRITGPSAASAHAFSFACTVAATLLAWRASRAWLRPGEAFVLALALASNWRWARDGAAIRSEPLFAMLAFGALYASTAWGQGGRWRALGLGLLLGAASLTRQVGLALAVALIGDLLLRKQGRDATIAATAYALVLAPWVAWLATVRTHTQVGLVPVRGLAGVVLGNLVFYARRLIDQVIGPVIEVATVFRPAFSGWATAGAGLAAALIVLGWLRLCRSPDARPSGLVALTTLALLLAWPFTEAGRFLVPLIPLILVGLCEGLRAILGRRTPGWVAPALVLVGSIPYPVYAVVSGRAEAARRGEDAFDSACLWISGQAEPPGPVLSRHPGEVWWQTGRTALAPPDDASPEAVAALIERYRVAYLLIDDGRFAEAPTSPLGRFARAWPGRVERVYRSSGERPVEVFRVRNPG